MPAKPLVMVADDDDAVAGSVSRLLETRYRVAPPVTRLDRLPAAIDTHRPNVLLLDLMWGSVRAIRHVPALLEAQPDLAICMLTAYSAPALVTRALAAGARGYLLKALDASCLFRAIDELLAGNVFLEPGLSVMDAIRDAAMDGGAARIRLEPSPEPGTADYKAAVEWLRLELAVSRRQAEVCLGVGYGFLAKQVATRIGLSEATVRTHEKDLYAELKPLGVTGRLTLAVLARKVLAWQPPGWAE